MGNKKNKPISIISNSDVKILEEGLKRLDRLFEERTGMTIDELKEKVNSEDFKNKFNQIDKKPS